MALPATRYRHLAELAVAHLESLGEPCPATSLAARLFAASGAAPFVSLVDELLAGDARFCRDPHGAWGLAGWEQTAATLEGTAFAVVDVETTGGRTEKHRLLEVAVVLLDGGAVTGHFESLINPQQPVPDFIAELTGITQEMVQEAPSAAEVLPEVRAMVGERVLVGHNVGCDLTFLNYESLWHDQPPFGNQALDTEELALRLLPDLRRPSLARVAGALGLTPPQRHRALPDARLTAAVLCALLRRLPDAAGTDIRTVAQLQTWLTGTAGARPGPPGPPGPPGADEAPAGPASRLAARQARVRRLVTPLPPGTLRSLPDAPGVYTFRDGAGQALYVGKAASLRERVAQHFSGTARALRRHDGLLERTAVVTHEPAGCELDALLLESARIRALQPPYNVQSRNRQGCPFLRLEAGPFPRAGATQAAGSAIIAALRGAEGESAGAAPGPGEDVRCAGPYRTTQQVRHTLETLRRVFQVRSCRRRLPAQRAQLRVPCLRLGQGLCPAPCAERVTPEQYGVLVDFAWRYVSSGREATLAALDARLARLIAVGAAGAAGAAPEAGAAAPLAQAEYTLLRECRARLWRVRREYRPVEGGLAGGALVMAYPAPAGGAVLFFVREGRLLQRTEVPAAALDLPALVPLIAQGLAAPSRGELDDDQTNILLRWIYRRSGHPECIPAGAQRPAHEVAGDVLAALDVTRG